VSTRTAGEPPGHRDPRRRAADRGAHSLTDFVIREASIEDAAAIADLHVRSWQAAYRGIVPDVILDGLSVEARRNFWTRTIGRAFTDPSNDARIWVIEANARGRRFYEAAGWRPDGARQAIDFDGAMVDEVRYRHG
jgi:hypothetical protein